MPIRKNVFSVFNGGGYLGEKVTEEEYRRRRRAAGIDDPVLPHQGITLEKPKPQRDRDPVLLPTGKGEDDGK